MGLVEVSVHKKHCIGTPFTNSGERKEGARNIICQKKSSWTQICLRKICLHMKTNLYLGQRGRAGRVCEDQDGFRRVA